MVLTKYDPLHIQYIHGRVVVIVIVCHLASRVHQTRNSYLSPGFVLLYLSGPRHILPG